MLLVLLALPAFAASVGDPGPDPAVGRLRLVGAVELEEIWVADRDCEGDLGCDAVDRYSFTGGEVQVALVHGLAVLGSLGRIRDQVSEADFDAAGIGWGLGVKGALPLSRVWWLHGQARLDHGLPADQGPGAENGSRLALTGTAGLAWGAIEGGFAGHVGVQRALFWQQELRPLGDDGLEISLQPSWPGSVAGGFSWASQPLGSSWGNAPRMVLSLDARAGQSTGVTAQLGLAF